MSTHQNQPMKSAMSGQDMFNMTTDGLATMLFSPVQTTAAIVQFFASMFYNIIRAACVCGELLFRRNFGCRYFNLYLYFGGAIWFWLFAFGVINIPQELGFNPTPLVSNKAIFGVIGVPFFGLMIYHLVIKKFMDLDLTKYGYYDGDPLPFLYKLPFTQDSNQNPKEDFVRQIVEPLFIALLGVIFMLIVNPQTGSFLVLTAVGFAIKEMVRQQRVRNMILDQVDADIIGRNLKAALKGESPKNNQGVYISGLPNEGKLKERFMASITKKAEGKTP